MSERERPGAAAAPERARGAVRGLPAPPAREEFRASLRRDFVAGTIAAPAPAPAPWWRSDAAWHVAAAAVLALAVGLALDRGPEWTVLSASGPGSVTVNGRPVALADLAAGLVALAPGAEVVMPADAGLELLCPGAMALEATPGCAFTVPGSPGRWLRRDVSAGVVAGEVRFVTGPRFRGARLRVRSPEARIEVTGTTLAVIRDRQGTCVCVSEGRVRIGAGAPGPMWVVPAGRRRVIYADARASQETDLVPGEDMKLSMLRDRMQPRLSRVF